MYRYLRSTSPRVIEPVTGHTYALIWRNGTVFVKPIEAYGLNALAIVSWGMLLVGLIVWASTWREWK